MENFPKSVKHKAGPFSMKRNNSHKQNLVGTITKLFQPSHNSVIPTDMESVEKAEFQKKAFFKNEDDE